MATIGSQLGDIKQSPGQLVHILLTALKTKARLCELTVDCPRNCCNPVDYSAAYTKDILVMGLSF